MLSIKQIKHEYYLKYNNCVEFIFDKSLVNAKLKTFAIKLSKNKSSYVIFSNNDGDNSIIYNNDTSLYTHSILSFGCDTRGAKFQIKLSNKDRKSISKTLLELKYVDKNAQYWIYQGIRIPLNIKCVKSIDDSNYVYFDGSKTEMLPKKAPLTLNEYKSKYAIMQNDILHWKV